MLIHKSLYMVVLADALSTQEKTIKNAGKNYTAAYDILGYTENLHLDLSYLSCHKSNNDKPYSKLRLDFKTHIRLGHCSFPILIQSFCATSPSICTS